MKKVKWRVYLEFPHLPHWCKHVVMEAKTKRKAMIAAEKSFQGSKANESLTIKLEK